MPQKRKFVLVGGQKWYRCGCGFTFRSRSALIYHKKNYHPISEKAKLLPRTNQEIETDLAKHILSNAQKDNMFVVAALNALSGKYTKRFKEMRYEKLMTFVERDARKALLRVVSHEKPEAENQDGQANIPEKGTISRKANAPEKSPTTVRMRKQEAIMKDFFSQE